MTKPDRPRHAQTAPDAGDLGKIKRRIARATSIRQVERIRRTLAAEIHELATRERRLRDRIAEKPAPSVRGRTSQASALVSTVIRSTQVIEAEVTCYQRARALGWRPADAAEAAGFVPVQFTPKARARRAAA